jgi:hypothetical protein
MPHLFVIPTVRTQPIRQVNETDPLTSQNAQRLLVDGVASSEHLIKHSSNRYFFVRRPSIIPILYRNDFVSKVHTYRPGSYSMDAIGDISECIVREPSNGRSGGGFTILASTSAITLEANQ